MLVGLTVTYMGPEEFMKYLSLYRGVDVLQLCITEVSINTCERRDITTWHLNLSLHSTATTNRCHSKCKKD